MIWSFSRGHYIRMVLLQAEICPSVLQTEPTIVGDDTTSEFSTYAIDEGARITVFVNNREINRV